MSEKLQVSLYNIILPQRIDQQNKLTTYMS